MIKKRVLINVPSDLLAAVDRQAKADFVGRSEFVRRALLEYLRPIEGRNDESGLFTDPDEVFRILQRQRLRAGLRQILKDMKHRRDGSNK